VQAGEFGKDEALPPVRALADEYQVSPGTVAKALRALEAEGLVYVVASYGSFRA
jgi:DNA-binding GntR family transcriptional regulator